MGSTGIIINLAFWHNHFLEESFLEDCLHVPAPAGTVWHYLWFFDTDESLLAQRNVRVLEPQCERFTRVKGRYAMVTLNCEQHE